MAKPKLNIGDRVAYAAKFLKNTGQFTGPAGKRRGTYLGPYAPIAGYGRVRWDDEAEMLARSNEDGDYKADVREHGALICEANIARVGSPAFALNDL